MRQNNIYKIGIQMKRLITSFVLLIMITNCSHANSLNLEGSEWGNKKSTEQFIQFGSKQKLLGFGGCNNFFGSYEMTSQPNQSKGTLKIGPLASTRKACVNSIMKEEFEFFKQLEIVNYYKRSSHHLELFSKDYKLLLRLRWRDFD